MQHDDPMKTLLREGLEAASRSSVDAATFEAGVRRKIQQRHTRRRVFQASSLAVCLFGISSLMPLGSTPSEMVASPTVAQNDTLNTEARAEPETTTLSQWEEDPFDSWDDDMPADYDLVAGI